MKRSITQIVAVFFIIGFSAIMLGAAVFMTLKNTYDLENILEDSIKGQLISTSVAARGILDVDKFDSYNSIEDVINDFEAHRQTLEELRKLQRQVGAEYIYALKLVNGEYHFVFDTDEEDDTVFSDPYKLSEVHELAFAGEESAGVMNVADEYGNFNTGAVPVWKDGRIIGIICTDMEDSYIQKSHDTARNNAVILIFTLVITMCAMSVIVWILMRNVHKMQEKLYKMANYDVLTGLPNRQYLMSHLTELSDKALKGQSMFALMLIDLDNFKKVNDNEGHDVGDELLRHIALYLDSSLENSKSFRPSAGVLDMSARIGGDEFVQIVYGAATEHEAQMSAQKLIDNFSSPTLDHFIEKYQVGLSIGVALFPYHTNDFNVLIKYADLAMYHAKNSSKNACRVYSEDMDQPDRKRTRDRRQNRR